MASSLPQLPLPDEANLETRAVLKLAMQAHRYLAELKGVSATIPNKAILINTLTLQEAKDSSAVENIITTQDDLYKAGLFSESPLNPASKEVQDYAAALKQGFSRVQPDRLLRLQDILDIQATLEQNKAGLRKLPGTGLQNTKTGETVYTPPQDAREVERLMHNLVDYLNDAHPSELDPLIRMAVIHHQFESIHPFHDGNGRTGRIINILYLVAQGLLDLPILYLSRYFIRDKSAYYQQLQAVRDSSDWEPWLLYMLEGVVQTSKQTIELVSTIKALMQRYKHGIRRELPKIYSQELLNNLFSHPYTKIDFVMHDLRVSRITAAKYLDSLVAHDYLTKSKIGRSNFYINQPLYALFAADELPR